MIACFLTVKNSLWEKLRDLKDLMPCQRSLCFVIITVAMLPRGHHAGHVINLLVSKLPLEQAVQPYC